MEQNIYQGLANMSKSLAEVIEESMAKELNGGSIVFDENGEPIVAEDEPYVDPMVQAIERALLSLSEIAIYGTYGRSAECEREA